jgi:hypothetical protein
MSDSAPHPFARPPNTAQAHTPFSMMKIQGMDQFYSQIPSMPLVLDTHDVQHQDWSLFIEVRSFEHYFRYSVHFPF